MPGIVQLLNQLKLLSLAMFKAFPSVIMADSFLPKE